MADIDWTGKILKIDNTYPDRVEFWISMNADKSVSFIASLPALEASKTVMELSIWAYEQYLRKLSPAEPEPT